MYCRPSVTMFWGCSWKRVFFSCYTSVFNSILVHFFTQFSLISNLGWVGLHKSSKSTYTKPKFQLEIRWLSPYWAELAVKYFSKCCMKFVVIYFHTCRRYGIWGRVRILVGNSVLEINKLWRVISALNWKQKWNKTVHCVPEHSESCLNGLIWLNCTDI